MKTNKIKNRYWLQYNCYFILEHFLGFKLFNKWFGRRKNNLFNRIDKDHNGLNNSEIYPITELDSSKIIDKNEVINKTLEGPVLFRGAASNWKATQNWDLDFFEKHYGNREIVINDLVGIIDPNNPQKFRKISLKKYISLLKNGSLEYLKFSPLVQDEITLQNDLDLKWMKRFEKFGSFGRTFYLFIGGKGSITPIHNEFPSVVYVQIKGRKKWTMYLPKDRIYLDPRTERRIYFYTNANPNSNDIKNYPLLPYARKFEAILEPGDVLWFPPFAWHHVENLEESIGVSYKFVNIGMGLKSSKLLTMLIFMATKPNLFFTFIASRFKKSDYALSKSEKDL